MKNIFALVRMDDDDGLDGSSGRENGIGAPRPHDDDDDKDSLLLLFFFRLCLLISSDLV